MATRCFKSAAGSARLEDSPSKGDGWGERRARKPVSLVGPLVTLAEASGATWPPPINDAGEARPNAWPAAREGRRPTPPSRRAPCGTLAGVAAGNRRQLTTCLVNDRLNPHWLHVAGAGRSTSRNGVNRCSAGCRDRKARPVGCLLKSGVPWPQPIRALARLPFAASPCLPDMRGEAAAGCRCPVTVPPSSPARRKHRRCLPASGRLFFLSHSRKIVAIAPTG